MIENERRPYLLYQFMEPTVGSRRVQHQGNCICHPTGQELAHKTTTSGASQENGFSPGDLLRKLPSSLPKLRVAQRLLFIHHGGDRKRAVRKERVDELHRGR